MPNVNKDELPSSKTGDCEFSKQFSEGSFSGLPQK